MGTTPWTYTVEFKRHALDLLASSGKIVSALAKNPGLTNSSKLARWRREGAEKESSRKTFSGHDLPKDEELDKLHKENANLHSTNMGKVK